MNNPFQKLIDKKVEEDKLQEEQQKLREERLRELEEGQDDNKIHIPNPIKTVKEKKEISTLKKEIAAYEEKKKTDKMMGPVIIGLVVLFIFIGVMSVIEEDKPTGETPTISTTAEKKAEENDKDMQSNVAEPSTTGVTAIEDETTGQETLVSDLPVLTAGDISVDTMTDYAHADRDVVFLGNGEGVTIKITSSGERLTKESILVMYDESLLNANIEVISDGDYSYLEVYVTGKKACDTEVLICTAYDWKTLGEEAEGYIIDIKKLDSSDGRIVYVTSSGHKYHFSEKCAGSNAKKTTSRDAVGYEYERCGNCG